MPAPISWRRNQFAVTAASFVGFTGFTLVMPFLPLYIRQLGVTDIGQVAMWAGLSLGATPTVTAALSPYWGRVADRYGRKLLVQRSLLSFVIIMAAMAWVTQPWHLVALRAIQGIFAGYGGLTLAMAAESAPREKLARAIGLVQTAQRIGPALGPVIGGVIAGLVGLRQAFFVASAFYAVALMLVSVTYQDPGVSGGHRSAPAPRRNWREWFATPGFGLMMAAIFLLTTVDRSIGPILPLWIGQRGVSPARLAMASGLLFSAGAFGAAVGNHLCELWLTRHRAGHVIAAGSVAVAVALLAFAWGGPLVWLAVVMGLMGVAMGAAVTAAYTEGGSAVPPESHGEGFGFLNGANLAGLALGPALAGVLSRGAMGWVFAIDVSLLVALALLFRRRNAGRA